MNAVPILIVDDNPAKRLNLRSILAPLGHELVEAESGEEALRKLMVQDFAVILLDVRMPLMDGFETASMVRMRPRSEMTPIIFITAYDSDEITRRDRYATGAVDFIVAPVSPDELLAKVTFFANQFSHAATLARQARGVPRSAAQLRLLTDAAPIGIFQTDSANRYVYTNPRWSQITGIDADEAIDRTWDTITDRVEIRSETGESRIVLVTATSIPSDDGGATGWVGTLADITTEVGAEAAMAAARDAADEASQLKSDFLANMSHEIRTPMNGVIGMTDLLLETDLDPRQRDYAQTVRHSGEALLSIINDILDFSKIGAGKMEVEDTEFGLRAIVNDVIDLLAASAQTKGIELVAVVDPSVPSVVAGDPRRVFQVLTNLVGNAIKFTQVGEVVVRMTATRSEPGSLVVRCEVSDTGDGIGADKLALIFEPFVQADSSTSRKYGGTGLGLAISSQLVSLMAGECGVTSVLGTGSTFWFTIVVRTDPEWKAEPAAPEDGALGLAPVTEGFDALITARSSLAEERAGRLLLAEDNPINQKVAIAILAGAEYEVDSVVNGAAAVKAAAQQRYDAILMDCQMPELSGYEATAQIRAAEGLHRHTPIIALTAGARREDRDRCLSAGMDSYLAKPVNKDALLALVARSVRGGAASASADPIAAEPMDDAPILDRRVLDELRVLGLLADRDFLSELTTQFVRDTDVRLVRLRKAFEEGDTAAVGRLAHFIKGSGGQLGGRHLVWSCTRMERKAASGDLIDQCDVAEVELDYKELCVALAGQVTPEPEAASPLPTNLPA